MHKLLQDGSKRSDANTATNQDGDLEAEPVLMALTKWTVQVQLGEGLSTQVGWVVVLPEVVGPGPDSSDVQTDTFLVRGGANGEGMELSWVLGQAGDPHPLPCPVVESSWPLEVDTNNLGR